jgi:hypothetical protein
MNPSAPNMPTPCRTMSPPTPQLPQHGGPMGDAVIAGHPHLLRASPFLQHSPGSLDRWRNSQITVSGDPPVPRARILVAFLVVRT